MAKEVAPRDVILMAMYAEHLKDVGDYGNVMPEWLNMDRHAYMWGLMQLRCEELVAGIEWFSPRCEDKERVCMMLRDRLHLTREGWKAAQKFAGTCDMPRPLAAHKVMMWLKDAGLDHVAAALM